MQFSTVRGLVGWAFQMSEAIPVKIQSFGQEIPACISDLRPDEKKQMATDILAKIARLPPGEYSAIAAFYTGDIRAINEAAKVLPWPDVKLRRMMARGWARNGLEHTHAEIAEMFCRSRQTITDYWGHAKKTLDSRFNSGLATIEVQVLDLLIFYSARNAHRERLTA
jgi:hypothetical protein